MPLSDRERRVLDEIERELASDDPRLVRSMESQSPTARARSPFARAGSSAAAVLGVLFGALAVGLGLASGGSVGAVLVAVLGFVLIVASCWQWFKAVRRRQHNRTRSRD